MKTTWKWMSIFWLVPAISGFAQMGGTSASVPSANMLTLTELMRQGGWLLYVLGGLSVLGLAFIIYFLVVLRRQQIVPDTLRKDVLGKVEAGAFEDARTACKNRPCAFSEIVLVALDFVATNDKADTALLKDVIEGEGTRQATTIQTETQYLLDIGVIAPMVGLLGTVFGMVHAFGVVALDMAKAKPMLLAGGVAEALVNTAGGLIVGIPAMMFYAYFRGRTSKLVSHLESASLELLTAIIRKIR